MSERRPSHRPAPEVNRGAFPMLATFLRGYLHQDWMLDHETAQDARDEFLRDASADERREFSKECVIFHERTATLTQEQLQHVIGHVLESAWMPDGVAEVRDVLRVPPTLRT